MLIAEKSRPGVNKEYSYDKLGRITEVKTGGEVTERYSYTTKGRTITFTDGKGSDYIYNYDEFGRLVSEKNRLDGTQSYTYNENSELKAKKDFEGNMTAVSYDTKTRTKKISYADGTENIIVYDECGNVLSATNESGSLSYIYDKAGFLTKETDEKTGENVNYFYDKAGRRTRLLSKERDISYNYGKNSELLAQKDRAKQLEVSYKYDISGREIERRFGNGVKQLTFNEKGTGSLETGASSSAGATAKTRSRPSNEYVLYSYGEPVAMTADGNTSYFGTDILGSVRNTTDKYGAVQANYNYDVFGNPYLSNLDHDIGFGYCGKVYDNGTGLYDYGFRDYSPNQARFTTIDPIRDGANWFSYVVNDPVNYIDPFGLWDEKVHFEDTKEWAKEVFGDDSSGSKKAEAIAKADNNTDKGSKGPMPWQDQSYHFNTSDAPSGSSGDTRIQHSEEHLEKAINLQNEANSLRENKTAIGIINKFNDWRADKKEENALNELGVGLHALQDVSAHTDEYVHDMWYGKSHSDPKNPFDNGDNLADDPSVNPERYAKVKEDTINYLNRFKEATKTKCGK